MEDNILIPQQLDDVQADMQAKVEQDKASEDLLASVVVTPAWEEVKKILEIKGSDQAICDKLRPLVTDATVSDARFGSLARSLFMSAKEVGDTLQKVLDTVKAHEK